MSPVVNEQSSFPYGRTLYIAVHPNDVDETAEKLELQSGAMGIDIRPLHCIPLTLAAREVVLLWSPSGLQSVQGLAEGAKPSYANIYDVDLQNPQQRGDAFSRMERDLPGAYEARDSLLRSGHPLFSNNMESEGPAVPEM